MPDLPNKSYLSISETAHALGVSIDTVRRWDTAGVLHSVRLDGKNRSFFREEIESLRNNKSYSISEAAHILGVSLSTLRRLEARGLLTSVRNARGERTYSKTSLEEYKNSQGTGRVLVSRPEESFKKGGSEDTKEIKEVSSASTSSPLSTPFSVKEHTESSQSATKKYEDDLLSEIHKDSIPIFPANRADDSEKEHTTYNAPKGEVYTTKNSLLHRLKETEQERGSTSANPSISERNSDNQLRFTSARPITRADESPKKQKTVHRVLTFVKSSGFSVTKKAAFHPKPHHVLVPTILLLVMGTSLVAYSVVRTNSTLASREQLVAKANATSDGTVLAATTKALRGFLTFNIQSIFHAPVDIKSTLDVDDTATFNKDVYLKSPNLTPGTGTALCLNESNQVVQCTIGAGLALNNGTISNTGVVALTAGKGVTVTNGTSPTITNNGVTSLGGSTGDLSLSAGTGISVSGLTINNTGVTSVGGQTGAVDLTGGTGISVSGTTINNTDAGSAQNIFKTFTFGTDSITAGSNNDQITFVPGTGMQFTTDTVNHTVTLTTTGSSASIINVENNGTSVGTNVTTLNFASDFSVTNSPSSTDNVAIDYTASKITRSDQSETISGAWTYSAATPLSFSNATPSLVIADGSTLSITDGTNTLLSLADSGTEGTLSVAKAKLTDPGSGNGASLCVDSTTSEIVTCASTGSTTTLQQAYVNGNTITTTDNRNIQFNLSDTTTDSRFRIVSDPNSTGDVEIVRSDGAATTDPAQMLLIDNQNTTRTQPVGLRIQANAGIATAIDVSDAEIQNALDVGSNTITGTNYLITASSGGLTVNSTGSDLALQTTTTGNITATLAQSTGLFNVLTGNVKVGNGTPANSLTGGSEYITSNLEVGANLYIPNVPAESGTGSSLCVDSVSKNITTCGSGVTSVNNQSGAITIANATASGGTITINTATLDNAGTPSLGLAEFNHTNFTDTTGLINTIQDINTTAAPTFAGLKLSGLNRVGVVQTAADGTLSSGQVDLSSSNNVTGQVSAANGGTGIDTHLSTGVATVNGGTWSILNQLSPALGGTGVNGSTAGNGTVLIGNGTGYTLTTLTAGSGIAIANTSGQITISQTGSGASKFTENAGTLYANNSTEDLFLGGTATTSAKFAFINNAAGTPQENISDGSGNSTYITANGTIATTNSQNLTVGSGTTGNIDFFNTSNSLTSSGNLTLAGTINGVSIASGIITSATYQGNLIASNYGGTGADLHTAVQGSVPFFSSTGVMSALAPSSTTGYVLISNGTGANPSWASITSLTNNLWDLENGLLFPLDNTADFAIGGNSSDSAKFAVLNVGNGTPVASVSAGTSGAAYLTANGKLATTAKQALLLGDSSTTGDINFYNSSNIITSAGNLTLAGSVTSAGLVSSGTEKFTNLNSTGIVHTAADGTLSTSAVALGSSDVSGTLGPTNGGTGINSYTAGDILYSNASNSLTTLAASGNDGKVLTIDSGTHLPVWATVGGVCADCVVTDPSTSQTIQGSATGVVGLAIKQPTGGTVDVFNVTNNTASTKYLAIGDTGSVSFSSLTAGGVVKADTNGTVSIGNVTLGAETTGNYVATITAGNGISGSSNTAGGTPTLSVNNGDGLAFSGTALTLNLNQTGTSLTTSSGSGLELTSSGLSLLKGCSSNEILKWNTGSDTWDCATDQQGSGTVTGSGTVGRIAMFSGTAQNIGDSVLYESGTNIGVGTLTPSTTLEASASATSTNTILNVLAVTRATSGTAANGIGAAITLNATNSNANVVTAGAIQGVLNTVTPGSETGSLNFQTQNAGTLATRLTIDNYGNLGVGTTSPTALLDLEGGTTGGNAALIVNQKGASTNDILTASASGTTKFTVSHNGSLEFTGGTNFLTTITSDATVAQTISIPDLSTVVGNSDDVCLKTLQNCFGGGGGGVTASGIGNTNYLARFTTNSNITKGSVFDNGTGLIGIGTASPLSTLHIDGAASGGRAALIVDQTASVSNDILTASSSGTTRFAIANDGTLKLYGVTSGYVGLKAATSSDNTIYTLPSAHGSTNEVLTTDNSGNLSWSTVTGVGGGSGTITKVGNVSSGEAFTSTSTQGTALYFNNSSHKGELAIGALTGDQTYTLPDSTGTICLDSNNCSFATGTNWWTTSADGKALTPINSTMDFLLGATATSSAKFAVLNLSGATPVASVSAGTNGAAYLTADGKLATTALQTLTLGDATTTGNILLNPAGNIQFYSSANQITSGGALTLNGGITAATTGTINSVNISAGGIISNATWNGNAIGLQYGGTGADLHSAVVGSIPYIDTGSVMATLDPTGNAGKCLVAGGAGVVPSWATCATGTSGTNYWTTSADGKALTPVNSTMDFLLGNNATSSAKFAVLNLSGGTPIASVSASSENLATYITGDGTIATTNRQNLTIGNSSSYNTTGNVLINPNGTGNVGIGTTNPTAFFTVNGAMTQTGTLNLNQSGTSATNIGNSTGILTLASGGASSWANTSGNLSISTVTSGTLALTSAGALNLTAGSASTFTLPSSTTAFNVQSGLLDFDTSHNRIGINTTTPGTSLDVVGSAQDLINSNSLPASSGSVATGGTMSSVQVQGRYAYGIDSSNKELLVFDITNPTSPVSIGSVTMTNTPQAAYDSLAVSGNYAYVVASSTTMYVIDISNPKAPTITATVTTNHTDVHIAVQGNYAYMTNGSNAIIDVVNISNASSPTNMASFTPANISEGDEIDIQGRYIYVVDTNSTSQLDIIDASNPSALLEKGHVAGQTGPNTLMVQGRYAYMTTQISARIQVVDVSDPTTPTVASQTVGLSSAGAKSIFVSGRYVFVGEDNGLGTVRIDMFDMSVPGTPVNVGTLTPAARPYGLFADGEQLYIAEGSNFVTYNLPGFEAGSVLAHILEAGSLSVDSNETINNDLSVGGGLNVGSGGIFTNGSFGVNSSITTGDAADIYGNSITTGNALNLSANGLTSGAALNISSTSTAATTDYLLKLASSGAANASNRYGVYSSLSGTGTTSTNVAGYFSATGATNNYALVVPNGNVGIGNSAPSSLLSVGSSSQFTINSSGAITAATGITSSGTITFSGFTGANNGGLIYANASGVLSQTAAGTNSQCLIGGTTPSWATCATGTSSTNYFQVAANSGLITPINTTLDFALGGTSTASANFALLHNAGGTPTASVAGNLIIMSNNNGSNSNLGGRLGIGTTTPNNAIQVAGLINFDNTTNTTSLGYLAGNANTGTNNLFVGSSAGTSNSSGIGNTFLGYHAGQVNTTGNSNVFVGRDAGSLGNGSNNTILGTQAGINSTGSNNVFLGFNAGFNETGSNKLYIANSNTSNPLIYGDFAASALGINTSAGGNAALAVNQPNGGDLFTASASGITKFTISNGGNLSFAGGQSVLTTLTSNNTSARTITIPSVTGNDTFCLQTAGNCAGSTNWWTTSTDLKALTPINSTMDFLLGANATSSAKFAVLNMASGTPTASISATATGTGLSLGGDGTIQSLNRGALTLGGSTTGDINIGTDANARTINIGNSTGATALNFTSGTGSQTFISSATTNNAFAFKADSLSSGTGLALSSISTSLTSGGLMSLDWSPGSATTSTGDLLSLNVGSNGTIGNILNIKNGGSSVFSVSQAQVTSSLPVNFTSPGDVSIAYDLNFTNLTTSNIKSSAPLTIASGDVFNSSDLNLTTYNTGNIIANASGGFQVQGGGGSGNAAAIINQLGSGDLFTASAAGTTKFVINSSGNVGIGTSNPTTLLQLGTSGATSGVFSLAGSTSGLVTVQPATAAGTWTLTLPTGTGSNGQVLTTDGSGNTSWTNVTTAGTNLFTTSADGKAIAPINSTMDFLLGGTASSSAKFVVLNMVGGTPTASVSAGTSGAAYLTAAGTLQTTASQALTLGGTTTGNINIGTDATARTVTVGNTTGATGIVENVGTGNYTLNGVAGSTYTIGASTTTGTITIGGTAQTGTMTLGSSSGTNILNIAGGTGATTLNLANSQTAGAVNIGAAMTTGTITIGGTGAQTGTIGLGTGTGAQTINLGTGGTGAKTVTVGSTASSSSLQLDSGTGTINIGTSIAKTITIGNSTGATALNLTSGTGSQTFTSSATTNNAFAFVANSLSSGNGINITDNGSGLTSGKLLNVSYTGTAAYTGAIGNISWDPGVATTATGDLLDLAANPSNVANVNLGNILNITNGGSSVFSVSQSQVTSSLPVNFTSPGDVSMAYDLNFTNPVISNIKSQAPLAITSGETFNSSDLTLNTYNLGSVIANAAGGFQVQGGNGGTGNAAAIINQLGSGDLFTASAAGTPKFVIQNSGQTGIGLSVPGEELDVAGNIRAYGTSGIPSMYLGSTTGAAGNGLEISYDISNQISRLISISHGSNYDDIVADASNIRFETGTGSVAEAMRIQSNGDVAIGDTSGSASNTLKVKGSLCVSSASGACAGSTSGTIYATNITVQSADFAENYVSSQQLQPGDVVVTANDGNSGAVVKATSENQNSIIGVVSTAPGVTINSAAQPDSTHPYVYPIALVGRAPAHVSTLNGPIAVGDALTSSSIPGVAVKATKPGTIIGHALETYTNQDSQAVGSIMIYANASWADPTLVITQDGDLSGGNAAIANLSQDTTNSQTPAGPTQPENTASSQDIATLSAQLATQQSSLAQAWNSINDLSDQTASLSAQVNKLAQINLLPFAASGSATFQTVQDGLLVEGPSSFADVSANSLTIGNTLSIGASSIDSLNVPLDIQPMAQANVNFEAGAASIDTQGNLKANGALFASNVTVQGVLAAKTVAATEFSVTQSTFTDLSDTVSVASSSAGTSFITAGQADRTIKSDLIHTNSLVYITPVGKTNGIIPAITDQGNDYVTIGIDNPALNDVRFNFLIVTVSDKNITDAQQPVASPSGTIQ